MNLRKRLLNLFVIAVCIVVRGFGGEKRLGGEFRDSRGSVGMLGSRDEWSCDLDIVEARICMWSV